MPLETREGLRRLEKRPASLLSSAVWGELVRKSRWSHPSSGVWHWQQVPKGGGDPMAASCKAERYRRVCAVIAFTHICRSRGPREPGRSLGWLRSSVAPQEIGGALNPHPLYWNRLICALSI